MSLYDDLLASDAESMVDPALMPGAEKITYTPHGGREAEVWAQVFRADPEDTPGGVSVATTIVVARQDVPVVTKNGDRVRVADQSGKTQSRRVVAIVRSDAGGHELRLE